MLSFHLFPAAENPRFTGQLPAICGILGLIVLIDILCIMMLSLVLGLWFTMAILASITSVGFLLSYYLVHTRSKAVINSTSQGLFDKEAFSSYFCALVASVFFIIPGIINTLLAIALAMRFPSIKIGEKLARFMGISWQKSYEYLRLN